MAKPTEGIEIRSIHLTACKFQWVEPSDARELSGTSASQPRKVEFSVHPGKPETEESIYTLDLEVGVRGLMGSTVHWELSVTYRGDFALTPKAPITVEQLTRIHAPAYLYSYCREHVSDLLRRTGIASQLYLPPFNFES